MKIGWIVLGVVLLGLGWWVTQPMHVVIMPGIWEIDVASALGFLNFPLLLCGAASIVYGFLVKTSRR